MLYAGSRSLIYDRPLGNRRMGIYIESQSVGGRQSPAGWELLCPTCIHLTHSAAVPGIVCFSPKDVNKLSIDFTPCLYHPRKAHRCDLEGQPRFCTPIFRIKPSPSISSNNSGTVEHFHGARPAGSNNGALNCFFEGK